MLTVCSHVLNALQIFFLNPYKLSTIITLVLEVGYGEALAHRHQAPCAESFRVMMPNIRATTAPEAPLVRF